MKWYLDRLLLCVLLLVTVIVMGPIMCLASSLVFVGDTLNRLIVAFANCQLMQRADRFVRNHETDTNKRKAKKKITSKQRQQ